MSRTRPGIRFAVLVVASVLAGCGESHDGYIPPPDAPIDHGLDFVELGPEEARALCEWWHLQHERVGDGWPVIRCGAAWIPGVTLEQCVDTRLLYAARPGCSVPVRTFYECAEATAYENFCDEDMNKAEACRLDDRCAAAEGVAAYLRP